MQFMHWAFSIVGPTLGTLLIVPCVTHLYCRYYGQQPERVMQYMRSALCSKRSASSFSYRLFAGQTVSTPVQRGCSWQHAWPVGR